MLVCNPHEIVIHDAASKGKIFRPSDWAERLCGTLSSFDKGNRLSHSNQMRPISVSKVRCVAVDRKLEEINPSMFRFLMDLATDNDSRIIDCKQLLEEREGGVREVVSETQVLLTQAVEEKYTAEREESILPIKIGMEATEAVLCRITAEEAATALVALSMLRPTLTDINRFVEQTNTRQRVAGYRLFGIFKEGKHNAVSVCGFREALNLTSDHHLHIDDIITLPQSCNKGHASRLLHEVRRTAAEAGITKTHSNVHVGRERAPIHRLCFNNGLSISVYHFRCDAQ